MKLPFGKFKGQDLVDVDLDYIRWLEEQPWTRDDLRKACQFEIERRSGDRPGMGKVVREAEVTRYPEGGGKIVCRRSK